MWVLENQSAFSHLQGYLLDFGRSPPLAVQPSFGRFFSRVNAAWVNGYKPVKGRRWMKPPLTNVVVVSVTGGAQDYQVLCYPPIFLFHICHLLSILVVQPSPTLDFPICRSALEWHLWTALFLPQMGWQLAPQALSMYLCPWSIRPLFGAMSLWLRYHSHHCLDWLHVQAVGQCIYFMETSHH